MDEVCSLDPQAGEGTVRAALSEVRETYATGGHGVELVEIAQGWQFLSRREYAEAIDRAQFTLRPRRLSPAALETLAIIAYRQPVGRLEVDEIRGVDSGAVIDKLVDGGVAELGSSVDPVRQRITLDGRAVRTAPLTWLALNKPIGFVVSRADPQGRRTVFDLLPKVPGLTYVGRLDVMTSGLLLLTTDGVAAHRLMHPRFAVPRTYWLRAHGLSVPAVERALGGAVVIDGRPVRIVRWRVRAVARGVELELTLAEGRQRIVRRLAEALGLKVEWLHRVAYGPVRLGRLGEGAHRRLTPREVAAIERLN